MTAHRVPVLSQAEMERRVARLGGYEQQLECAQRAVIQWKWSRGLSGWDEPEPLACERAGWKRGMLRSQRRAGRFLDQDLVGLDADGRPVVVRAHDGAGNVHRHTFLHWTAAEVQTATFSPRGRGRWELVVIKALLRRDGVPVGLQCFHPSTSSLGRSEVYEYSEDARLVGVELQIRYPADQPWPDRVDRLLPIYDAAGA